jgi:hypothetical protein
VGNKKAGPWPTLPELVVANGRLNRLACTTDHRRQVIQSSFPTMEGGRGGLSFHGLPLRTGREVGNLVPERLLREWGSLLSIRCLRGFEGILLSGAYRLFST